MEIEEVKPSVEYIDSFGSDLDIVKSAQITFDSTREVDIDNFINQLLKNEHLTPFEFCVYKLKVTCSIYAARQWMRHRTGTFAEVSGRHVLKHSYILPDIELDDNTKNMFIKSVKDSFDTYNTLINNGVKKEDARGVLPLCSSTTFLWKTDLRNLMHFLKLRCDKHSQLEIRNLSNEILKMVSIHNPCVYRGIKNNGIV